MNVSNGFICLFWQYQRQAWTTDESFSPSGSGTFGRQWFAMPPFVQCIGTDTFQICGEIAFSPTNNSGVRTNIGWSGGVAGQKAPFGFERDNGENYYGLNGFITANSGMSVNGNLELTNEQMTLQTDRATRYPYLVGLWTFFNLIPCINFQMLGGRS